MRTLFLTLDYELYGNGSGDVFHHIIEPTDRILKIAEKYNAKLTIFFEVVEYWKLKEEWEKGNSMGYDKNPIEAMVQQLRYAHQCGHDIQLHLHPQWVDAYFRDGKWHINPEDWRLGEYCKVGDYSLECLFEKGKRTIEEIIRPIDSDFQCRAVRAGGYNIQPSFDIVKTMAATGFVVDSSIYPGGKESGSLSRYDYSNIAVEADFWQVGEELECSGNANIIELPIVAFPIVRWKKYVSADRIKSLLQNRKSAQEAFAAKTSANKAQLFDKVNYFFQKEWQTWDYCLFSKSMHRAFLKNFEKLNRQYGVLVGHPKSFVSGQNFEYLLLQTQGKYRYQTITEFYKEKYEK